MRLSGWGGTDLFGYGWVENDIHTHTQTHTNTHTRAGARVCVCARAHARTRTHTHTHTCMCTYGWVPACEKVDIFWCKIHRATFEVDAHIGTQTRLHTNTLSNSCVHTHTHTHTLLHMHDSPRHL